MSQDHLGLAETNKDYGTSTHIVETRPVSMAYSKQLKPYPQPKSPGSALVGHRNELSDLGSTTPAKSGVVRDLNGSQGTPTAARHVADAKSLLDGGPGFDSMDHERFDQVDHDEEEDPDEGPTISSYSEVQAKVPEGDDPHMPINILRVWTLGTLIPILDLP